MALSQVIKSFLSCINPVSEKVHVSENVLAKEFTFLKNLCK